MTYKIVNSEGGEMIRLTTNGGYKFIPKIEDNRDYQDYLAWVAEGNTAEAAD